MKKKFKYLLILCFGIMFMFGCGHTHKYEEKVIEPTCTTKGYTIYTCECGDTYNADEVEALGHDFNVWEVVVEATEETEGLKERVCKVCNHKETESISKLEHTHKYQEEVIEPTCTTKGYTKYTCKCGDAYNGNETKALGHNEVIDKKIDATCTTTGLTEGKHCSRCNEVLVEQEEVSALGHNYIERVCSLCKKFKYSEGLIFEIVENEELKYARVIGKGSCEDEDIYIPTKYNDYSVLEISNNAFKYSRKVKSIHIPESVERIGDYTFSECTSLENIILPFTIKSIGIQAFNDCGALKKVYYNGSIEDWCNIVHGDTYDSNPMYYATSFYMLDENEEYKEVTELEIPSTITNLKDRQFINFKTLEKIILPTSLESIGKEVFLNCSSLLEVKVPESVISIGHGAFKNCSSLKSISIPFVGKELNGTEHTYFGYIFGGHPFFLDEIDNEKVPTSLEIVEITNCDSISERAFENCSMIVSIKINNVLKIIKGAAFRKCTSLENVYYDGSMEDWCNLEIENNEFNSCSSPMFYATNFYLKDKNNEYNKVTEIELNNTITTIDRFTFRNFKSLKRIVIPNTVISIGEGVFAGCSSLEYVSTPFVGRSGVGEFCDIQYWFLTGDFIAIKEMVITNSNGGLGSIRNCTLLERVCISEGIDTIGYNFIGCPSLLSIEVDLNNKNYKTIDGNLYSKDGSTLISYAAGKKDDTFVIPETVTEIGKYAFTDCNYLKNIQMPASLKTIKESGFNNMDCLENVYYNNTIESWCSINIIYKYSNPMYYAEHFYALNGNNEYVEVIDIVLDENIFIYENTFVGFDYLKSVFIGENVYISGSPFSYCASLESIKIDENNKYFDSRDMCNAIIVKENNKLLKGCKATIIPDSVTSIESGAFLGCSSLENIIIPNSVTSIGASAFSNCTSLKSITIPNSVTTIETNCFYNCSSLDNVKIPDSITIIETESFKNCTSLLEIIIPENVTKFGLNAFNNCTSLTRITLPANVRSCISGYEKNFSNLKSLEEIYYNGTYERWQNSMYNSISSELTKYAKHLYVLDSNGEYVEVDLS